MIDLMRRRDDAFHGVMEFLIAESLLAFQAEGYRFASLSAAPLAHLVRDKQRTRSIERALTHAAERLDSFYHFGSLNEFKAKFMPNWEPIYLAYAGTASLPRVGYALLRAYLPTLSGRDVRQLITGLTPAALSPSRPSHDKVHTPARLSNAATQVEEPLVEESTLHADIPPGAPNPQVSALEDWSGDRA